MARFNADGSPSGRPRYDEEGNPFVLTGQALIDSNAEAGSSTKGGGYGKKRIGKQSRGQMNLTSGRTSSILTSPY